MVIYDAKFDKNGKFNKKEPFVGYWWNIKKQKTEPLNWIEQMLAYGFDAQLDEKHNITIVKMKALKTRPVTVLIIQNKPVAFVNIDGKNCRLEKIYIKVANHLYPPLEYIEIVGYDPETNSKSIERIKP